MILKSNNGNRILKETDGTKTLTYFYGLNGVVGFRYNNTDYYYVKNVQGDVLAIYDASGTKVASYIYDAWGKNLSVTNHTSANIGTINPFRYRSYYYDVETELYYLQTRYYDPEVGRFINSDSYEYLGEGPELLNYNLFAYCANNPVIGCDPDGAMPKWLAWTLSSIAIIGGIALCATGVGGIAGGVLIGAGAGSLINGYISEANGGSFTAGYIGGAISGALCGTGAGLGGLAFSAASEAVNMACIGYVGLGVLSSFAGGFIGNLTGTVYTDWHNSGFKRVDIDWQETLTMSAIMGELNILAGISSSMSSCIGETGRVVAETDSKIACGILAGSIAGGTEALYDLISYLINKLISMF